MRRHIESFQRKMRVLSFIKTGLGTPVLSGPDSNQASLTDNGVGDYTITFDEAYANSPAVMLTPATANIIPRINTLANGSIRISTSNLGTAAVAPSGASSGLTTAATVSSRTVGTLRNADTITITVNAAAANPTSTILAGITGDIDAVAIAITPNDGTNVDGTAPTGITSGLTAEITYTSATKGIARNTDTITIQVLAAAANPTDTVLAAITGTIDAVIITITPNDGTNNGATPVPLTTAELAELVTNGTVAGKTVTVTDSGSLLTDLSATGGDTTDLADSGEGDGVAATLSGGAVGTLIPLTTAELIELITTNAVSGKTITVTDTNDLLEDLRGTGGGAENLANGGEGDGEIFTLANGADEIAPVAAEGDFHALIIGSDITEKY